MSKEFDYNNSLALNSKPVALKTHQPQTFPLTSAAFGYYHLEDKYRRVEDAR